MSHKRAFEWAVEKVNLDTNLLKNTLIVDDDDEVPPNDSFGAQRKGDCLSVCMSVYICICLSVCPSFCDCLSVFFLSSWIFSVVLFIFLFFRPVSEKTSFINLFLSVSCFAFAIIPINIYQLQVLT